MSPSYWTSYPSVENERLLHNMSTSEKWTVKYSQCPCGQGKIRDHVVSPDNAWSRPSHSYELACDACCREWVLIDENLHNRVAYEAYLHSLKRAYEISKELDVLSRQAIELILAAVRLPSFKEEYKYLEEARVCNEGPIRYKRAREKGISSSEMCNPNQNIQWIAGKVPDIDVSQKLNALTQEYAHWQERQAEARNSFQTIPISKLRNGGS